MLAITVLVALVLGGLAYVQIERVRASMLNELEQRATLFATFLSHSLAQPLWNGDTRAIDLQLAAPFDNNEITEIVVDALNYGVVAKKIKQRSGDMANPVVRVLPIDYSAFPNSPAQRIGDVRVVFSRATTDARIAEYQRAIALIAAAILVSLYIATFLLFRRMVHGPIKRLEETVDLIAAGDMHARSQVESRDELGRLAERFNSMADRLLKSSTQLRASEERFRDYVDVASDWFWETGPDHRFTEFSRSAADWGLPQVLIGKKRWDPAGDREEEPEKWRAHIATLEARQPFRGFRYKIPHPADGSTRYVSVSGKPVFDGSGAFLGYRGVAADVSAEVRSQKSLRDSEEALRQREKELREIIETIPAMTVTITADGRDAFIGKRFSEYSGLSAEDARGSGWKVTVHPDDLDLYLRNWRASLASGDPMEFETRVRRADGEYRWFLARAVAQKDEQGNVLKWYEVLTDIEDRKQAEAVLRERELRIRRLFDANIIGILISDFEGRVVEANDAFLDIVGYGRDDLIAGRISLGDMTPPEWRELQERSVEEINSSGTMPSREKEYFRKDGSRVPVLVGGAGLEEGGKHSVGFVIDLTEQKRAEAALRERDAMVRGLVDANIIGTFTWRRDKAGGADFRAVFQDVNDAFLRIVGYDREDLVTASSTWILTPPDWVDRTQRAVAEMQLNGAFQPYEKEFIRKDGSRVPVLVGAAQTGDTGIAFVLDLTDQKRAEAALRESEEQWKSVFENNPIMYFMVGATGTILSVNPFGAEQLGYTVDELVGRPVDMLFHEADRELAMRNKAFCLEHLGHTRSWELRKLRKDGEVFWVRETARAMLIKNRPVILVVSEDITEGKRVAEALREAQMELAHANRVATMGQLAASVVHEVSQPIATTRNNAGAALNFLDRRPPDLEEVREALYCIVNDADRAGSIIQRIRDQIKKAPLRKDSFDLNGAIHEVIALAQSEVVKNSVSVQMRLAKGLSAVQADRVQVQQVALNLILNAIDAISSVDEGPRELLISTEESDGGGVLVSVRDSGPGIDPGHLERVFEAFYTTKLSGVGMGLSICRSIIDAHGGRLWAEANQPKGAVFQFTLPVGQNRTHEFSKGLGRFTAK